MSAKHDTHSEAMSCTSSEVDASTSQESLDTPQPIVVPNVPQPASDAGASAPAGSAGGSNFKQSPLGGKSLGVMHPCGKMVWVGYQENWTTLDMLKQDVAAAWGENLSKEMGMDFQVTRATPLLSDALIDYQCMQGEILYVLPKPVSATTAQATTRPGQTAAAAPDAAAAAAAPAEAAAAAAAANTTTAAAAATTAAAAAPPQSRVPCADASLDSSAVSADSVPVTPVAATAAGTVAGGPVAMQVGWYQLPLDEKIAHAAHNLQKIVANPKQCTELQANLEQAHGLRVDCSSVFQKVEHHLQDFVVHPAGNYLVSKCFDYYTDLIQQAADLIGRNLKTYALHKHASYVIETMLTHQLTPIDTKKFLITEILAASNRVTIATHDSGNFVIQRAIECCPEDLLPMMVDSVQAVSLLTPHGAKMLKKVQARLSRSNNSALLAKFGGSNSKRTQERRHGAQPAPHQQPQHHQQPPQHQHQQQQKQQHPPMQYGQAAPGCPTDVANPPMGQGHMASHYPPVHPSQQSFQQSNQQPHVPGAHHLPPSQHLPPATETFCDPYDPGYQGQYYEYPQQQQQQQQQPPQQQTRNAPYNTGYQQEQVHKHAPYALSNADSSYSTGQPSTPPTLDDMNACDNGYMQAQWADCHLEMQH